MGWLDAATFKTVVASTPLLSIDLLVENERGEYLLGLRKNRPAKGYWFVPGGRVQKNESLDDAFNRISTVELNVRLERSMASFLGVYEHFYNDSFSSSLTSTHYIVLAYKIKLKSDLVRLDMFQHYDLCWSCVDSILTGDSHIYTKRYFEFDLCP
jgi:colanic acid biosynthesis protein WcaH